VAQGLFGARPGNLHGEKSPAVSLDPHPFAHDGRR
jgi:hypothetical protein